MASRRPQQRTNTVRMHRHFQLNLSFVISMLVLLYFIIVVVNYMNRTHISIYEVTEKSIAEDNVCHGMIIRNEMEVKTKKAGYINYYIANNERVSKNQTVYSVDEGGNIHDMLADSGEKMRMTKEDIASIRENIAEYRKNYSGMEYSKVQSFRGAMDNAVLELTNMDMLESLNSVMSNASGSGISFNIVTAPASGMISYFVDDYIGIRSADVTKEMFEKDYERVLTRTDQIVNADTPVYKLVTDENWEIVLNLSKEQYNALKENEEKELEAGSQEADMIIHLVKSGLDKRVTYRLKKKDDAYFAIVSLDKYMGYYIDDRFIDVALNINVQEGLKIPKSAILKKEFYVVPIGYVADDENSSAKGVYVETYSKNGAVENIFTTTEIYYQDENVVYLNKELFEAGSYLCRKDTGERFQLGETVTLEGVYNTNKGYCIFKQIERLSENDEYCIVSKDTPYGISVYDHIIVDASTVNDQEIISKR